MVDDESRLLTRDIAPFGVRMPAELKKRVQAAAEFNNRSMNAEIVATLEDRYPAPIPEAEDIMIRIEAALREQGTRNLDAELSIINRMLEAADYPFRIKTDEDGMCLSISPVSSIVPDRRP